MLPFYKITKASYLLLSSLFSFCGHAVAQENDTATLYYYWVTFTDKADSPYSIDDPAAFLSPRAIERREKQGIPITEQDIPVNPAYLAAIRNSGIQILHRSKWFNAATVICSKKEEKILEKLPFVKEAQYVGRVLGTKSGPPKFKMDSLLSKPVEGKPYGHGQAQVELLKGERLHQLGYRGKGIYVGVLDGGFTGVDVSPFFDSLRQSERLLFPRDFVDADDFPYESSSHGTKVLSTMAANVPEVFVGTAPLATYVVIKTEDTRSEQRIEECNWVAGLEYADSLGLDIVNSSLGYTTFDDRTMDYEYSDLNGKVSVASQAADIAFEKGMIVVTSAGNEGSSKWKYIGIPADSEKAFSIGATNINGTKAGFSSFGPSADGRVKPDVAAPGSWVTVADAVSFRISTGSGTSFASPIACGLVACLWEAFPDMNNQEILDAIRQSSHQYEQPDYELGYGIPDFEKAYQLLQAKKELRQRP
ncbi:MAG TPA: S8 family serine peptidase [Saprospiraceae bacterium]|nr:S8 family serine peptidase [Saprospiraceae bacterium]HMQ81811.1 S8 family serine peptidase [Saprospiraceae bacterium]